METQKKKAYELVPGDVMRRSDGTWCTVVKVLHAPVDRPDVLRPLALTLKDDREQYQEVIGAVMKHAEVTVLSNAELQRPREAGSVARSGSPAKREARPQQPEVPQSPAERGIAKDQATRGA